MRTGRTDSRTCPRCLSWKTFSVWGGYPSRDRANELPNISAGRHEIAWIVRVITQRLEKPQQPITFTPGASQLAQPVFDFAGRHKEDAIVSQCPQQLFSFLAILGPQSEDAILTFVVGILH